MELPSRSDMSAAMATLDALIVNVQDGKIRVGFSGEETLTEAYRLVEEIREDVFGDLNA